MSIRLTLQGKVKEGVSRDAFIEMAKRASAFSEQDAGVTVHEFYLTDDGQYWEEHVFTDEAGFFAHIGPATDAGIIDDYMSHIELQRVLVLDPVNDEMRTALAQWGAVYGTLVAGF